jgi:Kef-type K+ transport system membrane component KefB
LLTSHPTIWILLAAVLAPLLAEIPLGFKVPVVVLEVVLGIVIGPHVLGLVHFEGFVVIMFAAGMAMTLFMAGMELDFSKIKGRPLSLATGGWIGSVLLGFAVVGLLHVIPQVHAPYMVTLALCTTGLGVLVPVFRDDGQLETAFGRLFMAVGTLGEVGPIVAMSLLLSARYSTWQEAGFLFALLAIVGMAVVVGMRARPPKLLALLGRQMHSSNQLPVRISLLMLWAFLMLAEGFGFERILGAFAAGMVVGQATRGEAVKAFREKIEAVSFGWFYPFFFVGTGIKFDITALGQDITTMLMLPMFAVLFLVIRGAPVFFYRDAFAKGERLPFVLASAVPSLSIIVVITEIGAQTKSINPDVAAALIGAALLAVLLFPTIAGVLLQRIAVPRTRWEVTGPANPDLLTAAQQADDQGGLSANDARGHQEARDRGINRGGRRTAASWSVWAAVESG